MSSGPSFSTRWLVQKADAKQLKSLRAMFSEFFRNLEVIASRENSKNSKIISSEASPVAEAIGMGLCYLNKLTVNKTNSQTANATQTGVVSTEK